PRWFVVLYCAVRVNLDGLMTEMDSPPRVSRELMGMQIVSAEEKVALERRREELRKYKVEMQERIRAAAGLGDLSENAEYHFAKEENRNIERELAELEQKLKTVSVVGQDNLPDDVVFLGHTVKLLDLDDDSEQLVRL